jgi:phosphopantothenoylcysteine decarboxylase/phosphopantothenate--cysteine ligase
MESSRAARTKTMKGRRVVVTAGPTREALDPVRFLSNHSSGKMGYALAEAARDRGRLRPSSVPTRCATRPTWSSFR